MADSGLSAARDYDSRIRAPRPSLQNISLTEVCSFYLLILGARARKFDSGKLHVHLNSQPHVHA